jgi:23S rRNA pseudouridine1911/1915/1917 synthase
MKYPQQKSGYRPDKLKEIALKVTEPAELLQFLLAKFPEKSRTAVKLMLTHKQVSVGDQVTTQFDFPLIRGQVVYLNRKKSEEKIRFRDLRIVHEDNDLMVVEKGSGLHSIAPEKVTVRSAHSMLTEYVKKSDLKNQVYIIFRLDRDSSGLMLFAKSKRVQELLQKAWNDSVIEDTYVAVVEGIVEKPEGSYTSWLKENKAFQVSSSQNPDDGQKAITHYKVIKTGKQFSLLEVMPETSCKNQIRVHLKDLGFPITGDKKFGASLNPFGQIGLHCRVLSFKHPVTGKTLRTESPVPGKFMKLFR